MVKIKFVDVEDWFREDTIKILRCKNIEFVESDNPDFIFYSVFGYEHMKYDCVRIFFTGENIQPDFNICDYAIGFSNIEYGDRYLRCPLYYFYTKDYERACNKPILTEDELQGKKFCNFVYSNSSAYPEREQIFRILSEYKRVDSGGKFLNNIGGPISDKYEFQRNYKFSIAFENACTAGYTTEKILQAFAAGTVPIYYGNPNIAEEFNEKAFINCHKYGSFAEVRDLVEKIDKDDRLFLQYRNQPMKLSNMEKDAKEAYADFVEMILRQEPHNAIRRCNQCWGTMYQDFMRSYIAVKEICKNPKGICDKFVRKNINRYVEK